MQLYLIFLTLSPELLTLIRLQGDMGFQGRSGPPGPPGIGEPGLPVSISRRSEIFILLISPHWIHTQRFVQNLNAQTSTHALFLAC